MTVRNVDCHAHDAGRVQSFGLPNIVLLSIFTTCSQSPPPVHEHKFSFNVRLAVLYLTVLTYLILRQRTDRDHLATELRLNQDQVENPRKQRDDDYLDLSYKRKVVPRFMESW